MSKVFQSKIIIALAILVLIFLLGILGFRFLFEYEWVDAIYMTVITITTVGFGELHPLTDIEKLFISFFILSSIFIVGYAISVITEYILSKNNIGNLKQKRVEKKIESLQNHVVVCGYGRNGKQAVQKLIDYRKPFIIVEKDEEVVERFEDEDTLFVFGDASEDEVLLHAGIDRASTLICALPSDADNLFIVLSARQINKNLKIISRATEETSYKKLKLAGADNVIMPDKIGGDHMASLVVVPDLVEFLDNLSVSGDHDSMNVEQVSFENICSDGKELAIVDLDLRKKTGCSIIGYKSPNGEYIVNPEPSLVIKKDSKLILLGRPNQIESLKQLYNV
ncbi:potassium channel family protein [Ulvibacter litoralis]|uniref:Voltage-gated potassium channel n=1 Tax=Ulvibacter litoralis TaxID=227084 RepID=A0A1G7INW0_9FLAO|nr:potassium channel protein [Ulvibacter litoralis]GHC61500.1 potassium channel protein [Ulvibacter litoralis]SDF14397.1 voltage-gated potassium channel [Ulvibacter litoralis]